MCLEIAAFVRGNERPPTDARLAAGDCAKRSCGSQIVNNRLSGEKVSASSSINRLRWRDGELQIALHFDFWFSFLALVSDSRF